eukprot:scaffold117759_cov28-Tisochrysis_lutea.AAC.2
MASSSPDAITRSPTPLSSCPSTTHFSGALSSRTAAIAVRTSGAAACCAWRGGAPTAEMILCIVALCRPPMAVATICAAPSARLAPAGASPTSPPCDTAPTALSTARLVTSAGSLSPISSAWKGAKMLDTEPLTVEAFARSIGLKLSPRKLRKANLIVVELSITSLVRTMP